MKAIEFARPVGPQSRPDMLTVESFDVGPLAFLEPGTDLAIGRLLNCNV